MTLPDPKPCPVCGEICDYQPPRKAEPDVNVPKWAGGYSCSGCSWEEEDDDYTSVLFGEDD